MAYTHWHCSCFPLEARHNQITTSTVTSHHITSHVHQTLIVLNTLKPECAVLTITPGSCLCQCSSFTSCCPWCINNSCGGTSTSSLSVTVSVSRSTARSHNVTWSSAPDAANTVLSVWCHSTDVIGAVWCLNTATGLPCCKGRRFSSATVIVRKYRTSTIYCRCDVTYICVTCAILQVLVSGTVL